MKALGQDLGFSHNNRNGSRDTIETLCKKVDDAGGWNPLAVTVKFQHSDERKCIFSDNYHNSGWWTVVLTRDDYYWYKLSERKKKAIYAELLDSVKLKVNCAINGALRAQFKEES
jgi:hypothetical protein